MLEMDDGEEEGGRYRTVRAWRSMGAPERTAAATDSPGSLPSITRLGIGENVLECMLVFERLWFVVCELHTMSGSLQLPRSLVDALQFLLWETPSGSWKLSLGMILAIPKAMSWALVLVRHRGAARLW